MPAILAKKLGMTQLFMDDGKVERVTVLEAGPCPVTAIRTNDRDGYEAVQLAFGATKEKALSKAELGHLKKADAPPLRHIVEFRDEAGELTARRLGHRRGLRGRSDGQGLRHLEGQGLRRARSSATTSPAARQSHGSHNVRAPGSIGASAWPARVMKGIRGPGQMGNKRVTQKGLADRPHRRRRQPAAAARLGSRPAQRNRRGADRWLSRSQRASAAPTDVKLDETVFGARFNGPLVHESVRAELNARRQGTASTKTRGKVRGGGSKPWRQKGTGRARAGSSRSPIWTGGGTVFGPSPRRYTFKINRKERRAALRCALSLHAERSSIGVFDPASFSTPSTSAASKLLGGWGAQGSVLVVLTDADRADGALVPQPGKRARGAARRGGRHLRSGRRRKRPLLARRDRRLTARGLGESTRGADAAVAEEAKA